MICTLLPFSSTEQCKPVDTSGEIIQSVDPGPDDCVVADAGSAGCLERLPRQQRQPEGADHLPRGLRRISLSQNGAVIRRQTAFLENPGCGAAHRRADRPNPPPRVGRNTEARRRRNAAADRL